jgi:hypothetical protein
MSDYQSEQLEALSKVRLHLHSISHGEKDHLRALCGDYLEFRRQVDLFLEKHFSRVCDRACYRSQLSACCSREGIVTFFADVVINVLFSEEAEVEALAKALANANTGFKCIYLDKRGCLWRVKPIVCQMFLCEPAKAKTFGARPAVEAEWLELERRRKQFTWPERPVLFDAIEAHFIAAGCVSPLMYLHNSPGLLRIKRQAGI